MLTRENEPNDRLSQALDHAKTLAWKREGRPVCDCCGARIERAVADHNHVTLQWRGEICYSCNSMIGYAEWVSKNREKFRMIVEYLKKYDPTHPLL